MMSDFSAWQAFCDDQAKKSETFTNKIYWLGRKILHKSPGEPDSGCQKVKDKDAYIKKLERRIHNQRVALRMDWQTVEMRSEEYCGKLRPLRSKWWDYVQKLSAENSRLRLILRRDE